MRKSELRTIVRKIVREEVAMAIHEVITEMKQPSQQVSPSKPKVTKQAKQVMKEQNFSSNSVINKVLNETANSKIEEWETLGGGTFDSSRMNEGMAKQYEGPGTKESGQAQLAASLGADPSNPPDFLTKDYSQLMQKVDEKAKQTRG